MAIDVLVRIDDGWFEGSLEHWRQNPDDSWQAFIRWSEGPGMNHSGWYDHDAIRRT